MVVGAELSFQRRAGILQPLWPWMHLPCASVSPNLRGTMMLPYGAVERITLEPEASEHTKLSRPPAVLSLWTPPASAHRPLRLLLFAPQALWGTQGRTVVTTSLQPRVQVHGRAVFIFKSSFSCPGHSTWPLPGPIVS